MKTLGILLIGATCLLAGCACDCNDKLGDTGAGIDTVGASGAMRTDADNTSADGGGGTAVGGATTGGGTHQHNSDGTATGTDGGTANGTGSASTGTTTGGTTKAQDPRTYNQSGGGMGYRTDTIDEYKGIGGSARDKGGVDNTTKPK